MDDAVRAEILELLGRGTPTHEIAQRLGVAKGTVVGVKVHLGMGTYRGSLPTPGGLSEADVGEIEDAADLKFGLVSLPASRTHTGLMKMSLFAGISGYFPVRAAGIKLVQYGFSFSFDVVGIDGR